MNILNPLSLIFFYFKPVAGMRAALLAVAGLVLDIAVALHKVQCLVGGLVVVLHRESAQQIIRRLQPQRSAGIEREKKKERKEGRRIRKRFPSCLLSTSEKMQTSFFFSSSFFFFYMEG